MRRRGAWKVFSPGCILRRMELYDSMQWQPNEDGVGGVALSKETLAAAAPEGGPILHVDRDNGCLDVYTASGRHLKTLQLPSEILRGSIDAVGWSAEESPLIVQSGGPKECSIGVGSLRTGAIQRFKIDGLKQAPVFSLIRSFGVFLLFCNDETNNKMVLHTLLLPENSAPEQVKVDGDDFQRGLHSVTCIEAVSRNDHESYRNLLYMCGFSAEQGRLRATQRVSGVFTVDVETGDFEVLKVRLPEGAFCQSMVLCPARERFAMLLSTGTMWLCSADMTQVHTELRLGITHPPDLLQWCGSTFVHMLFHADAFDASAGSGVPGDDEDEYIFPCHWSLFVPAPRDESVELATDIDSGLPVHELIKWDLDSPSGYVLTTTEIDGLRVISDQSNMLFEVVPTCLESACHLRAQTVSSCLCRCIEDMSDPGGGTLLESAVKLEDILSGKTLRAVGDPNAVPGAATTTTDVLEELLDAASLEYEPEAQATILNFVSKITLLLSRNRYVTLQGHTPGSSSLSEERAHSGNNNNKTTAMDVIVPGGMLGVDAETMRDVCRRLRMLNDVRNPDKAGMLITLRQYQVLSGSTDRTLGPREADVVIHRLINHGDFVDAARLMHYFGYNFEIVALQWAKNKVRNSTSNTKTHDVLSRALRSFPTVDTIDVAKAAVEAGNTALAVDLLQSEKHSAAEVLLLLQLGFPDLAVEKALGSDDSELVTEIMLRLMTEFPKLDLLSALVRFPDPSQNIFRVACEHAWAQRQALFHEFAEFADQHTAYGYLALDKALRKGLADNLMSCSRTAVVSIDALSSQEQRRYDKKKQQGHNNNNNNNNDDDDDGSGGGGGAGKENPTHDYDEPLTVEVRRFKPYSPLAPPTCAVDLKMAAEMQSAADKAGDEAASKAWMLQIYLSTEQQRLADQDSDALSIVGAPLLQTLRHMYKSGEDAAANEMAAKFNTSERALILAKLDAYSSVCNWDPLDMIAGIGRYNKNKMSPLRPDVLEQFIETAHKGGEHERAVQLVAKLPSLPDKLEWFVKLDEFQRAADAAFEEKKVDMLRQLRRRSQNPQMQKYIDDRIKTLE